MKSHAQKHVNNRLTLVGQDMLAESFRGPCDWGREPRVGNERTGPFETSLEADNIKLYFLVFNFYCFIYSFI